MIQAQAFTDVFTGIEIFSWTISQRSPGFTQS